MTVTFARATRRDVRPIAGILAAWRQETDWMPPASGAQDHRAAARLLLSRTTVTVVRRRRRVLGFIAVSGRSVQSLYLAPEARGQDLGRRLLEAAKTRASRLELWTHQANAPARRFYARQGFYENRLTNGEANDDNMPDVHLVWARAAP